MSRSLLSPWYKDPFIWFSIACITAALWSLSMVYHLTRPADSEDIAAFIDGHECRHKAIYAIHRNQQLTTNEDFKEIKEICDNDKALSAFKEQAKVLFMNALEHDLQVPDK